MLELVGIVFACVACFYAGYQKGRAVDVAVMDALLRDFALRPTGEEAADAE